MCPLCDEPMITVDFRGVEIDCCPECGGLWLDAGELDWIAELSGAAPGRLRQTLETAQRGRKIDRRCPSCGLKLEAIHVRAGREVVLDRCPKGHGLWFDAGELPAVVEALREGEDDEVVRLLAELHGPGPTAETKRRQM